MRVRLSAWDPVSALHRPRPPQTPVPATGPTGTPGLFVAFSGTLSGIKSNRIQIIYHARACQGTAAKAREQICHLPRVKNNSVYHQPTSCPAPLFRRSDSERICVPVSAVEWSSGDDFVILKIAKFSTSARSLGQPERSRAECPARWLGARNGEQMR